MQFEYIPNLLSIIIPVYNKSAFITCCLESVSKQSYQYFEVIIIDDGSTDGSAEICDNLLKRYNWLKVFHTENRGVSAARNLGLQKASGELILFIDVDDYPLPTMFQKMSNKKSDLVVCNWADECHKSCSKVLTDRICTMNTDEEFLLVTPDLFKNVWNKCFRMDVIRNNNIHFEESICHAEDALFSIDYLTSLGKDAKIVLLSEPLYFHRRDVAGSLIKDHDPIKWRKSARLWWEHVERISISDSTRQKMLVRCLQNDFFVSALEKDYAGLKSRLHMMRYLLTKKNVSCWSKLQQLILLSKNAFVLYLANRLWCKVR